MKIMFLLTTSRSTLFPSSLWRLLFQGLLTGWLFIFLLQQKNLYAQNDSISFDKQYMDSLLRANMQEEMEKNIRYFREKQTFSYSMEIFGYIRQTANKAQEFLNKGIDSLTIEHELEQIIKYHRQSVAGVFPANGALPSYRNLVTTELLLGELMTRLNFRVRMLHRYLEQTELYRSELDSLITDTTIYHLPSMKDSVLFNDYIRELTAVSSEITPVDELINNSLRSLRKLDLQASTLRKILLLNIKQCAQYRDELAQRLLKADLPVSAKAAAAKSLPEAIELSFIKSELLLKFYIRNNIGLIIFTLFLFLASVVLLTMLGKKVRRKNAAKEDVTENEILDYPAASAAFLALAICQFFFRWPPFVFYGTGWLLAAFIITRIYLKKTSAAIRLSWLLFLAFFIVAYADNLLLFYTESERYLLIALALISSLLCLSLLKKNQQFGEYRQLVIGLAGLQLLLSASSLVFNLTGHYNLSKLLLNAGFFGAMTGVLLFYTGKMINDWLNLASRAIENSSTHIYLNFRKEEKNIPPFLKWLLITGWVLLFLRNFPFYQIIASEVRNTLSSERSIGNFSFSLSSILVFITVIIAAVLLAKFIALFTSNENVQPGNIKTEKKGGINNWLLLIRITVITAGILLAFASAGIPMDKITIIIGSLGVGIGLGLQNIVGNLFSGIILAFERPFEIGDQIEVDNRRGKVKEMGFRSSRIITFEGSEVIIPNGDLLSHHVINYTLSNNFTRVELMVGVKYGSNLKQIKQVLENMLRNNNHVRQHPAPQVLLHSFSESSVDFRLLFWSDINIWVELKSEIILAVDTAFREAGVEIPYPQLDVHIISSPGTAAKPGDDNAKNA